MFGVAAHVQREQAEARRRGGLSTRPPASAGRRR